MEPFQFLFTPVKVGRLILQNRIMSTGHMTTFVENRLPNDRLIAYHEERAKGGAGLIVMEANAVHPTAYFTADTLVAYTDEIIPYYQKLAEAVHKYGTKMFVQLFHPGREVNEIGPPGFPGVSPSATPTARFKNIPKELEVEEIQEIIEGYAAAAMRVKQGGLDGVELVASHGYLFNQFWSPNINFRDDQYGGDFAGRMRFTIEVIQRVREAVGDDFVVGMRLSGDDLADQGMMTDEILKICEYIEETVGLDYFNVTGGHSSTETAAVFIAPPAPVEPGVFAPVAGQFKSRLNAPVFMNLRVNDPVIADKILASGQADVVGMTRALICDPHMPNKASQGKTEEIRYCIGCNQACIGHMEIGLPISCIQNPVTGRELQYAQMPKAQKAKKVLVVGGGPAGMKCAVIAAQRGHEVHLYEKEAELGGLVRTAIKAPNRSEFGDLILNLQRELKFAGVHVRLQAPVDEAVVQELNPDVIVMAVGGVPYFPQIGGTDQKNVYSVEAVLNGQADPGQRVVVYDWNGDWAGVGVAEFLADQGKDVEIVSGTHVVAGKLQRYLRDVYLGNLYTKRVKMTPHYRIQEINGSSILFYNMFNYEPYQIDDVDGIVLATGYIQRTDLYYNLKQLGKEIHRIGDCLAPRTAENAILEGLELAAKL
ncbi:FAD-dependent oxidoreductase [Brevibacillus sp. B_LB10_24]|uniref:oxidoreductase n=1 Tax=Brevibacillus sp. B_LB10_24 TaxID=3380645 RepID=UPI0038B8E060